MTKTRRTILCRLVMLAIVAAIGICSRAHPIGVYFWDKTTGDLCYAVGAFLLIGVIAPRLRPAVIAVAAFGYCLVIELFKLSGLPAKWSGNPILRTVYGSTFSMDNILRYGIAIGLLYFAEMLLIVRASARAPESFAHYAQESGETASEPPQLDYLSRNRERKQLDPKMSRIGLWGFLAYTFLAILFEAPCLILVFERRFTTAALVIIIFGALGGFCIWRAIAAFRQFVRGSV